MVIEEGYPVFIRKAKRREVKSMILNERIAELKGKVLHINVVRAPLNKFGVRGFIYLIPMQLIVPPEEIEILW